MENILIFAEQQPGLLAITIMLFYAMYKANNGNTIEHIISVIIIVSALVLQYKSTTVQIIKTGKTELKVKYLESALLENNITSISYKEFRDKEIVLNKLLKIVTSKNDNNSSKN